MDDVLVLEGVDSYDRLEVYDLQGHLVHSQEEGFHIDFRGLPTGVYLLKIGVGTRLRSVRILKR